MVALDRIVSDFLAVFDFDLALNLLIFWIWS